MKKLILYFAKKYIVGAVNDLLSGNKGKVLTVTNTIGIWVDRLERIIAALKSLNAKFSDGEFTDDELKESTDEFAKLVNEFK